MIDDLSELHALAMPIDLHAHSMRYSTALGIVRLDRLDHSAYYLDGPYPVVHESSSGVQ